MNTQRQTPRSLAVLAAALATTLACSNSEDAAEAQLSGAAESGEAGSATDGESDNGTDGGEDEGDTLPEAGPEDPDLAAAACDPAAAQVLTFGLAAANSEVEPELVRESVLAGGSVPVIPLSARPFLNHFDFAVEPAKYADPEIGGELWQPLMIADGPPRFHLQYAISGPQMANDERPAVDLAIVVDLGALMAGEPLTLAEEALAAIESALIVGDRVTLIAAGPEPIVLGTSLIDNLDQSPLTGMLEQQQPAALADVAAAVGLAYETITPSWDGQGQGRVLLISNGHFDGVALLEQVADHAAAGRYLGVLGLGDPAQFDTKLMLALATEGRGASLFARDGEQLWLELDQDFAEHMIAVATDLEVTLVLPPGLAIRSRELYMGAAAEPKLALLGPNGALVFHHELEACAELDSAATIRVELGWTDVLANEAKQLVWEQAVSELGEGSSYGHKGAATVAYARALRAFRDGRLDANGGAVLDAVSLISTALEGLPEDADLLEMSTVLAKLSAG